MKTFEISNKAKNGRRKFKMVLHVIHPDSCVVDDIGTEYNDNGITWLEKYVKQALPTISGMSLRVEFADETRTSILGHGLTEIKDGFPIFENATVVGTFDKGWIEDITDDTGTYKACVASGTIDEMCYKAFVDSLEEDLKAGNAPYGSVEIYKVNGNPGIVYENISEGNGRIPKDYMYSGHALLGVVPADYKSRLLELNSKKGEIDMTDEELKSIITTTLASAMDKTTELNSKVAESENKIAELNQVIEEKDAKIVELNASVAEIKAALDELKAQHETYWAERDILEQELAKAKVKEKIGELNSALEKFTDEEKKCAEVEINSFNEDPLKGDVDAIVSKICTGIVMAEKEAAKVAELNSANNSIDDIFSEINSASVEELDDNIF